MKAHTGNLTATGPSAARLTTVGALALLLLVALTGCGKTTYQATSRPTRDDAEATKQVTRFFEDVKTKDKLDLQEFLAPNFVQQRTTGDGIAKEQYIQTLPDLYSYSFTPITGLRYNDTLTATYQAKMTLLVNGKKYPKAPVPFLTTFVRIDGVWHELSNGNFGVPTK